MSLTKQEQKNIIDKIKNSRTFSKTSTSIALLQYLFQATIDGKFLKEGIIDIEFFKESEESDKNNSRVRVNIYNLRKKLVSYYENEGKEDPYRVIIDKGQYRLEFEKKKSINVLFEKNTLVRLFPYLIIVVFFLIIVRLLLPSKRPSVWKPFLSKNISTTLYIGDSFGIYGKTITGNFCWIRDYNINNLKELYQFSKNHPELSSDIKPASYSYTTEMAVLSTQKLQSLFQDFKCKFNIRFSTKASISDIISGNAIYVGSIKNDNPFIHFFNTENPYFKIDGNYLSLSNHPSINDTVFNLQEYSLDFEYAIVSKIPGPNNTKQLLFFSNHDIGVTSTVEYLTNIDTLKMLQNSYLQNTEYFTAVFNAKGKDRTNTDLRLIYFIAH